MKRKNFIKRVENFVCINCGYAVRGSGYTNHCPNCLYSLHVDKIVPGDRKSQCGGKMAPLRLDIKRGKYIIIHKCLECGKEVRNETSENDSFEEILKLSHRQ